MKSDPKAFLIMILNCSFLLGQIYVLADPLYILELEQQEFSAPAFNTQSLLIRPFFKDSLNGSWSVRFRNEHYFNNNAPNQENMDVRYFGKGYGWFLGLNVSYWGRFLAFSFEPYWLRDDNKPVTNPQRPWPFTHLNDVRFDDNIPFIRSGFREVQLYLHYKGIGFGFSNASLWWGPGIHSTISMTNNTVGFPHVMAGTLKEIQWKNMGFNGQYTFGRLNEETGYRAIYFTALTGTITFYTAPIITLGFSRNYLTGGVNVGVPWRARDAAKIIFEPFFKKDLKHKQYTIDGDDPWDQTIFGYCMLTFPESGLKLFLELGDDDHRMNMVDFRSQPDHTLATVLGFRKYGLFGNNNLIFGFEYLNMKITYTSKFRSASPWYSYPHYNASSYQNRRWGAHSGSDSDDFLIYFGYQSDKFAFIPGFNYERHGTNYKQPAEVKLEFRLDLRYHYKGFDFNVYYERQYEEHLGFPDDNVYTGEITGIRRTRTLWLGAERTFYITGISEP